MGFKDAVMGFAGKLGNSIDKGITSGKDGYDKMSDRGRIKRESDQLTSEINNIMLYVGKTLYADDPGNEKFKQAFSDIKAREEKLAALQKELEELDKQPATPQQPYVQPVQPYAQPGQPVPPVQPQPYAQPVQPMPAPTPAPATMSCKSCGAGLPTGALFCDKCGAKQ